MNNYFFIFFMPLSSFPLIGNPSDVELTQEISKSWGFPLREVQASDQFFFEIADGRLQLSCCHDLKIGPVYVDFVSGAAMFRRRFARGQEAVARAVGLKKGLRPTVVDATAGFGRDAFVLASLGCRVHMIERSAAIAALLEDGLKRARLDPQIGPWVSQRLSLSYADSCKELSVLGFQPDVVYLDPMFPERRKAALVKKEMRVLQLMFGKDMDADQLLAVALTVVKKRVVVKRPAYAGHLADKFPDAVIKTPKNRFDIYLV